MEAGVVTRSKVDLDWQFTDPSQINVATGNVELEIPRFCFWFGLDDINEPDTTGCCFGQISVDCFSVSRNESEGINWYRLFKKESGSGC